jgi:hypothetical protein
MLLDKTKFVKLGGSKNSMYLFWDTTKYPNAHARRELWVKAPMEGYYPVAITFPDSGICQFITALGQWMDEHITSSWRLYDAHELMAVGIMFRCIKDATLFKMSFS